MTEHTIGIGDIKISLDGAEVVLRPTWKCCQVLSQMAGGLHRMQIGVAGLEFEAICQTISQGLPCDLNDDLREKVFRSGLTNLFIPVGAFLSNVANGGKPMDLDAFSAKGDDSPQKD